jgi:DNA-binding NtrC family response regulator
MTELSSLATQTTILVVIPDESLRAQVLATLDSIGTAIIAENTAEAEAMLRHESFSLLIAQDELPAETGVMFFARINDRHPWMRRILLCRRLEPELLMFLINEANLFRCATLPLEPTAFRAMALSAAEDHARLRKLAQSAAEGERWRAQLAQPSTQRFGGTSIREWAKSLPRIFVLTLLASAWALLLGTVVILLLYFLKSALGIDVVEGMHFRDFFR